MRDLASFSGCHCDETIIVCGCGASLSALKEPERFVTIGVNDVGRLFDPTYLVVVNPRSQFTGDRFQYVASSRAHHLFTQLDLGVSHPSVVRFRLGEYGGTTFSDPQVLHYTRNSPYVALCLAAHMGARRIGLIGVDFTADHFFGATGTHRLAGQLDRIDAEYHRLAAALTRLGIEVINLSAESRLRAFPKGTIDSGRVAPRVFCVTYRFLACGDVFSDGLRHAAEERQIEWAEAPWDDPALPSRIASFAPDLLLVIHGRRFARKKHTFGRYRTAVWLLDEPYEVDDTTGFARVFDQVFVNDPATLDRHQPRGAYLPVCYDPRRHHPGPEGLARSYDTGFVGGGNPTRERMLGVLARAGRLGYVVGGPWTDPDLRRLSLSRQLSPDDVADLYRRTKIVINVFRDRHHFNRQHLPATSMNPRIYEALACGALVISEARPEITKAVPELPIFEREQDLLTLVERFLADDALRQRTWQACFERLRSSTYAARLDTITRTLTSTSTHAPAIAAQPPAAPALVPAAWTRCDPIDHEGMPGADAALKLRSRQPATAGSERGLVTTDRYRDVSLSFEVRLSPGACFIAKLQQASQFDQQTNSYHLYCDNGHGYLARHHCVFRRFDLPLATWLPLRFVYADGVLSLSTGERLLHSVRDGLLSEGFAFVGVKRGEVELRRLQITSALSDDMEAEAQAASEAHAHEPTEDVEVLLDADPALAPRVSIVTTVYDRVDCLAHCIRSVRRLRYANYEHIIVADHPAPEVVQRIATLVRGVNDPRLSFLNLHQRHNNWGIAPAAVGLRRARTEYVCFLSDDNGYAPDHVGTLVDVLDRHRALGFAYSSCRYAGRAILRHPVPAPARIDLGQPMFRRELFRVHLNDDLPFDMMAWDWVLIDTFIQRGVRWQHVDVPSFIFRLARYPQLMAPA